MSPENRGCLSMTVQCLRFNYCDDTDVGAPIERGTNYSCNYFPSNPCSLYGHDALMLQTHRRTDGPAEGRTDRQTERFAVAIPRFAL